MLPLLDYSQHGAQLLRDLPISLHKRKPQPILECGSQRCPDWRRFFFILCEKVDFLYASFSSKVLGIGPLLQVDRIVGQVLLEPLAQSLIGHSLPVEGHDGRLRGLLRLRVDVRPTWPKQLESRLVPLLGTHGPQVGLIPALFCLLHHLALTVEHVGGEEARPKFFYHFEEHLVKTGPL